MNDIEYGINLSWLDEKIKEIKNHKIFYFFIRIFLFKLKRKLTYKELFLIFYGIERKKFGEEKAKEKAFHRILKVYMDNNDGKLPKGYEPKFENS